MRTRPMAAALCLPAATAFCSAGPVGAASLHAISRQPSLLRPATRSSLLRPSSRRAVGLRGGAFMFVPPSTISYAAWDAGVALATVVAATAWVQLWTVLAGRGAIAPKVSRKIIHFGSGPLFMLLWPFFSPLPSARFVAASVPLLQTVRLTLAGLSKGDNGLVKAVSRSGEAKEALQGPLLYLLVLVAATLLEWRTSIVGILAICQMAAGDGLADLIGRKWGKEKWWFCREKSYVGSAAFVAGGFAVSLAVVAWFHFAGCLPVTPSEAAMRVAAASVICALVEVAPIAGDDNVSVPVAAAFLGRFLFPGF